MEIDKAQALEELLHTIAGKAVSREVIASLLQSGGPARNFLSIGPLPIISGNRLDDVFRPVARDGVSPVFAAGRGYTAEIVHPVYKPGEGTWHADRPVAQGFLSFRPEGWQLICWHK